MRRSWERALLVGTLAGALVVGCSDDGDEAAPALSTVGSTTSTEPADPFAVPEVIDEAYVRRVLTEIYRIQGDAFRSAVASEAMTDEALRLLESIYADEEVTFFVNDLATVVGPTGSLPAATPGDIQVPEAKVLVADPDCIVVGATLDYSEVVAGGAPRRLLRIDLGPDVAANRTGWRIERTEVVETLPADGVSGSCT